MEKAKLILITGGCRSGKSEYAEKLALEAGEPVAYLATSVITDAEFSARVRKHRERRPANWQTLEEPLKIPQALKGLLQQEGFILMDSLSGWLTNLMYYDTQVNREWNEDRETEALQAVGELIGLIKAGTRKFVIVSDEVGFGLVPPYEEGRAFRDLNGKANQLVAGAADQVYLVVAGIPVRIK